MLSDRHWLAVLNRDRNYDGVMLYGVVTTKIYCVPSCPSRKPKRFNVVLFKTYAAAERIVSCVELGYLLVATTEKGICTVQLGDRPEKLVIALASEFKRATLIQDDLQHQEWIATILESIERKEADLDLPLDIRGTAFQQQVWQALQNIPYGATRIYQEIANKLGRSKATRAIGNACGANAIAVIIPCHRVMRSDGSLGGYRWGIDRKQKLIEIEQQNLRNQPDKNT